MNRSDDRFRRGERRIDLHASGDRAVRFGWMIEQFLRELHRTRKICSASIKFAVNKIGAPAKEQSERRSHTKIVAQIPPRNFVTARVIKRESQQPDHSAVARNSTLPDTQDRQRLTQHLRFVEKNVTEPPADDHAKERAASDEVANFHR